MLRRIFLQMGMLAGLVLVGAQVSAETQTDQTAQSNDEVVLTIRTSNGTQETTLAELTMKDLQAMPQTRFQTETVWTEGKQEFTGVSLAELVKRMEFGPGMLEAWAINDYLAEIPVTDARPEGPIIAYLRNGSPMSVREKGPLWVIYPYDSDPAYQREEIYVRSVWQLNRLVFYP